MRTRTLLLSAMLIVVIGLSWNLVRMEMSARERGLRVDIVPYTVVLQEEVRRATGQMQRATVLTYAVRGDGAQVIRTENLSASAPVVTRTLMFADGLRAEADDIRELRVTTFDASKRPAVRDPDRGCALVLPGQGRETAAAEQLLRYENVGGYKTVVRARSSLTAWYALDLGCAPLRKVIGPAAAPANVQAHLTVTSGEPVAALFVVDPQYREVVPSVFYRLPANSPTARARDQRYAQLQKPDAQQTR